MELQTFGDTRFYSKEGILIINTIAYEYHLMQSTFTETILHISVCLKDTLYSHKYFKITIPLF